MLVGDNGYQGDGQITTPNSADPADLRKFKSCARACHETFNARVKNYKITDTRFRHDLKKHQQAFEAVCVIVQYQLENGSPLIKV